MSTHGLGPTRADVLEILQKASTPLTAADVATQLDLHPNSARHHLTELLRAGFVESSRLPTTGTGRPRVGYTPTERAPQVNIDHLVQLTSALLTHFCAEDPQVAHEVGVTNARRQFRNSPDGGELLDHLDDAGFAPQVVGDELRFSRCPYRAQIDAETMPAVCALHQGFLDGALGEGRVGALTVGPVCTVEIAGLGDDPSVAPEYLRDPE